MVGLVGNSIGLIIFSKRAFNKFPSRFFYIALALIDTFNITIAVVKDILYSRDNDVNEYVEQKIAM